MQSFLVIFNYCLSRFISYLLSFENLVIEYRMYIACERNRREFFTDEKRRPAVVFLCRIAIIGSFLFPKRLSHPSLGLLGNTAVVVIEPFSADFFDDLFEQFDLREKGMDVGLRNFEIGIVTRFDIRSLQQIEQPFFFGRVARERLAQFGRISFTTSDQFVQIIIFRAV